MGKICKGIRRYPRTISRDKYLIVNENYKSINGEGPLQGYPTVILRLTGCNLRCVYCDTKYSYFEGKRIHFDEILKRISAFKIKNILITGGEPLCQPLIIDLCSILLKKNFIVSIETNGSFPLDEIPKDVLKIVDVKTPDSGSFDSFFEKNLKYLNRKDCLKFVLISEKDYRWAKNFIKKNNIKSQIFFSPVYKKLPMEKLVEWVLKDNLNVRISFQLHKYIWGERRGV